MKPLQRSARVSAGAPSRVRSASDPCGTRAIASPHGHRDKWLTEKLVVMPSHARSRVALLEKPLHRFPPGQFSAACCRPGRSGACATKALDHLADGLNRVDELHSPDTARPITKALAQRGVTIDQQRRDQAECATASDRAYNASTGDTAVRAAAASRVAEDCFRAKGYYSPAR
jgi:hypothetical protein